MRVILLQINVTFWLWISLHVFIYLVMLRGVWLGILTNDDFQSINGILTTGIKDNFHIFQEELLFLQNVQNRLPIRVDLHYTCSVLNEKIYFFHFYSLKIALCAGVNIYSHLLNNKTVQNSLEIDCYKNAV